MSPWRTALTRRRRVLLAATVLYSFGFYLSYVIRGNHEFVLYIVEFFGFIALACVLLRYVPDFPDALLVALSIVGLLHVMGGGLSVGGVRLYDLHLFTLYDGHQPDLYIFKYDELVHLVGFGVGALALRWVLGRYATGLSPLARDTFAVLTTMGLGALNEISEFLAVILFARTGVGGYYNTALDLTFNMLGALLAVLFAAVLSRTRRRSVAGQI